VKAVARRPIRAWTSPTTGRFHELSEIAERPGGLLTERIGAKRLLGFRLERAWASAVGERVRAVTRLHECRDRTLIVDVSDAAWKRELEKLQHVILARLTENLPERPLAAISFRLRPARWAVASAARPAPAAVVPGPPEAKDAASDDAPPGALDDRLRRVMSRYLSRRTVVE